MNVSGVGRLRRGRYVLVGSLQAGPSILFLLLRVTMNLSVRLVVARLVTRSACPTASPGDVHRWSCPRHRPTDGPPGSSRRRARAALPHPARASCLADRHVLVVEVAHLTDGRHAIQQSARISVDGSFTLRVVAFLRDQLHRAPRSGEPFPPLPGFSSMLCTVRAGRDVLAAAGRCPAGCRLVAAHELVADLHSHRLHDVALLAIGVVQQRDTRGAVRVVPDGRRPRQIPDLSRLKSMMRTCACVHRRGTRRHVAGVASAAGGFLRLGQRLVRRWVVRSSSTVCRLETAPRRGNRLCMSFDRHDSTRSLSGHGRRTRHVTTRAVAGSSRTRASSRPCALTVRTPSPSPVADPQAAAGDVHLARRKFAVRTCVTFTSACRSTACLIWSCWPCRHLEHQGLAPSRFSTQASSR